MYDEFDDDFYDDDYTDSGFEDPGGNSSLRRETASNPRNRPCPTCGEPNTLTLKDEKLGYQFERSSQESLQDSLCDCCADRAESGFGY